MAHVRVRVKRAGFIGNQLRRPGDELTLADEKFVSKVWMEIIPMPKAQAPTDEPDATDDPKPKRNK